MMNYGDPVSIGLDHTRNPDDAYVTSVYPGCTFVREGQSSSACMRRARSLTLNGRFTVLFIAFLPILLFYQLGGSLVMFSVLRFPCFVWGWVCRYYPVST